jgi:hypothetical protein
MRVPRVLPTVLDQHSGVATWALLASEEAAGEFVYVRVLSMRALGATGKVSDAYVDASTGRATRAWEATEAYEAGKVILGVPALRTRGADSEKAIRAVSKRLLNAVSGPKKCLCLRFRSKLQA